MIEVELKYPIELEDDKGNVKRIEVVTLPDRMKVKHMRQLPDEVIERMESGKITSKDGLLLLQILTGLSEDEFGEIDPLDDIPKLTEQLPSFLGQAS